LASPIKSRAGDVTPFCDLGESPDPVLLFAVGIDCVFDEFNAFPTGAP